MDIGGLHARAYTSKDDLLRMTQYGSQDERTSHKEDEENLPVHIGTTILEKVS